MNTAAKLVLFIGICLVVAGAVVGFVPRSATAETLADFSVPCGSALGGGVADPPPACAEVLELAGWVSLTVIAAGVLTGSGAVVFGKRQGRSPAGTTI